AIPGFGYDGQCPPVAFHTRLAAFDFPSDDGVAHNAYAVGVRDHDGAIEEAGVFEPCSASHFSVAIEGEPATEDCVSGTLAAGEDGGYSGADGTLSYFEFAAARDQRGVAYFDAFDVGNGVVGAGFAIEGDA